MAELFKTTYLELVLGEMAEAVKAGYIANLQRHGHSASGNLTSTITTQVEKDGDWYEVSLNLQDYWAYVEDGTRGRQTGLPGRKDPPVAPIYQWIAVKGIVPSRRNGRLPSPLSLAYAIAHTIGEYGTIGTHDLQEAKDSIIPTWEDRILAALERDTLEYIEKVTADIQTDSAV